MAPIEGSGRTAGPARGFGARPGAGAAARAAPARDEESVAELDAELVRADAHVRSASVGLWLVVIIAAVCAVGFVGASLFLQR
jgi:hypothetical protein